MKASRLFVLVAVLVGTLLLSEVCSQTSFPVARCALPGTQCKTSSDCCSGSCCVSGICRERKDGGKGVCTPCDEIECQIWEPCQLLSDPACKEQDKPCGKIAQCVSVGDPCSRRPRPHYCVVNELCSDYECPEGEQCYVIGVEDCPPGKFCILIVPTPICAPADPCNKTICYPGFKCVNVANGNDQPYPSCQITENPCQYLSCPDPSEQCYIKNDNCLSDTLLAQESTSITPTCAPSNPCKAFGCKDDYMCIIVGDGYYEPSAQCVPRDNICAYTICRPEESCIVIKRFQPMPVCTPGNDGTPNPPVGNPCDGVKCKEDEKCYYEKTCSKTSCYLTPRCVPANPCENMKCGKDYFCHVYEENGRPIGRCTPFSDPCAFMDCKDGAMCIILKTYPPQPKCTEPNPNSLCYMKKCPPNTKCEINNVNGTQKAHCVYIISPCEGLICPPNEFCTEYNDKCDNIPTAECGNFKLCDKVKCPEENQLCQEFNNWISPSEAFCVKLITDPCRNMSCPEGQNCYIIDSDCLQCQLDVFCTDVDPCRSDPCGFGYDCVTIDHGVFSPEYRCVPISNPCDNIACPEFQQCYPESPDCALDPNNPNPVCAYSNPCNHICCPEGTICSRIQEGDSPPKAQCVQISDPCYGIRCPVYQKCYLREVVCVRAPCLPIPECAYYDPCMVTDCAQYYKCVIRQKGNNPPEAKCVLDYKTLCANKICPQYQMCYLKNDTSVPPETVCDYENPCMLAKCSAGNKCVIVDNGYYPPQAKCVPDRDQICEGVVCPTDRKCYLKHDAGAECAYEDPCIVNDCEQGYVCHVVDHGDYRPTAECVLDPKQICLYHSCPWYQQCYLMDVYCKKAPCYPIPVCAYPDPCVFSPCGKEYKCVVVKEKPKPPTAYCLKPCDECTGVECKPGYSCYVKNRECSDLDCYPVPPSPVCSLPDPCYKKWCPANTKCEVRQLPYNNPPEARCVRPESPCDNITCELYEQCYIKDYVCNATGYYEIAPVGECSLPDPCIAAQCITGTVCMPVQIRNNPPQAACGPLQLYNPCNNYFCENGQKCYIKDVECGDFNCTPLHRTAQCGDPNPCRTMECIGNTVCVNEQTRNNPPVAKCRPPRVLCDNVRCDVGKKCYVKDYECNTTSDCRRLRIPYAVCEVSNPCLSTLCIASSSCHNVQIRNNPPKPVCIRTPSGEECDTVKCDIPSYKCYVKDMNCDEFNCNSTQPVGVCSMINPCSVVRCAGGPCVEVQKRNNPPKASCQPADYCKDVNCTNGEKCFVKDFERNENGYHYIQPTGVCRPPDPCRTTLCVTDTYCLNQQIRDNPPFPMCASPGSPCDMVDCMPSDFCYVKDYECNNCTCKLTRPTAVCAPSDPCYNHSCAANSVCIPSQIRRNPQKANCVSNTQMCNSVRCGQGEKCYIVQVFCIRAPCPPQPMCLPVDQCANKTCLPGYRCVNTHYGVGPPFAKCVNLDDPCDGLNCTFGQECYLREKSCRCPPCGYEPVCANPNPCFPLPCPPDHGCYTKRVGRLEPQPICYPRNDTCKYYDCLPGQGCVQTKIACQPDLPCPVPVCTGDPRTYLCNLAKCGPGYECVVDTEVSPPFGKCVPHRDPCDYTICPSNSSCVVLEKYPPVGRCLNTSGIDPCFAVRCKQGYQCVNTGKLPAEAQCIPTCAICPPTTHCIVHDSNPNIMSCCPNPKCLITYSPS